MDLSDCRSEVDGQLAQCTVSSQQAAGVQVLWETMGTDH